MRVEILVPVAVIALAAAGCSREKGQIGPERAGSVSVPAPTAPSVPAPAANHSPPISGARFALATRDAGDGSIKIIIPDRPTRCGPLTHLPATCEPAWRVRIDLISNFHQPGKYTLVPDEYPHTYFEKQGKYKGVWGDGANCKDLGRYVSGSLEILAIDDTGVTGILTGADEADGLFRAQRCPDCQGVRMACTRDAECCLNDCTTGHCSP